MSQVLTKPIQVPLYVTDSLIRKYGTCGYSCWVWAYNSETGETETIDALIAAPSRASVKRVLQEELGNEWQMLDWNATDLPF